MIMMVPGMFGASALVSGLLSGCGTSTLGASTLGACFTSPASPCSGASFGDSTPEESFAALEVGWAGVASEAFGAIGPVPTTSPRLSLVGLGSCSLTLQISPQD